MSKTVKITTVTITHYEISKMDAESVKEGAEVVLGIAEHEYWDDPFDTLDHFTGVPETTILQIEDGPVFVFNERN